MKKGILRVLFILLAVGLLFGTAACQAPSVPSKPSSADEQAPADEPEASQDAAEPAEEQTGKLRIGLSWFSMSEEYLANLYAQLEKYAKEEGLLDEIELILLDANMDAAKQNEQVDNLIAQNVDAIVIIPFDREQQVPAILAAKEAGIPIIECIASTTAVDDRTSYVGSDDLASGIILMTELARVSGGEGNMVIIHGPAGQNAEIMRHTGAEQVLKDFPNIQITAEKICDWDRAKAMSAMENILASDIKVDIVFAEDDGMAMGVLEAIQGTGREGIVVGSIDGIPDAFQAVKDGRLACTVFQNAKAQAIKTLQVAIEAAKGNAVEKVYDVPYELVTIDTVDDYIKLTQE